MKKTEVSASSAFLNSSSSTSSNSSSIILLTVDPFQGIDLTTAATALAARGTVTGCFNNDNVKAILRRRKRTT